MGDISSYRSKLIRLLFLLIIGSEAIEDSMLVTILIYTFLMDIIRRIMHANCKVNVNGNESSVPVRQSDQSYG